MEKTIELDYRNSGVKTLRGAAVAVAILGSMGTVVALAFCFASTGTGYSDDTVFVVSNFSSAILTLVVTIVCVGICYAQASLSEKALIARHQLAALLEEKGIELKFKEKEKKEIRSTATSWQGSPEW